MSAGGPAGDGPRILVVAGEASGDTHAAGLIREARALLPGLEFAGMGGPAMRRAGVEILHDAADVAVVGIAEVFEKLGSIRRTMADLKRRLAGERWSAVLLVDLPDFNLHLAARARRLGLPVVYFISPQLWAWRPGRVRRIRRRVDRMLCLFPFEERFYREHGVPATFVGHPLADYDGPSRPADQARRRLGLPAEAPVFGLLPGSRSGEIARLLEPMIETARLVLEQRPDAAFLVPVADTLDSGAIVERVARTGLPIVALKGAFDALIEACDAALVASGTATLEVAVRGVPPVVVYRMAPTTYLLGRMTVRVPHVSLVNLIAERRLVPELIQREFTPQRAASELLRLGLPGENRDAVLEGLREVRRRLGPPGAYRRAAEALVAVLREAGAAADA
ncbi:MAG: lipid-A-disaccharide synthase [Acidobacteriota bacterium]|nr:MAG: lipid-A-disaccharide synthase [Acidobacteriota bacterium]